MKPEFNPKKAGEWIRVNARNFWQIFTRRLWLKVISFLLAILVWNFVVSGDTSITRSKTLYNVSGSVTGQATLSTFGLALVSDPAELMDGFTVRMDVAQSQYSYVTTDNVRVSLDLSRVRNAGTQEVPLTAVTAYGRVVSIQPESVTLTFENLDSRSIPINVEFTGDVRDDLWYNVNRTNPTSINVSGASSVVRSIVQARVYTDVSEEESSFTRAEQYVLLDNEGNEINPAMLSRSSSSVTVVTEVLPTKELPISTDIAEVVTGRTDPAYEVTQVTIQPETVVVAADGELLDSINELTIEPVSIEGVSQSFTAKAKISLLSDFRYVSAEEVYVNVTVESKDSGEWLNITGLALTGLGEGQSAVYDIEGLRARVSGDPDIIDSYKRSGIVLTCDVSDLPAGVYECELIGDPQRYPGLTIKPEIEAIEITITDNEENTEAE